MHMESTFGQHDHHYPGGTKFDQHGYQYPDPTEAHTRRNAVTRPVFDPFGQSLYQPTTTTALDVYGYQPGDNTDSRHEFAPW